MKKLLPVLFILISLNSWAQQKSKLNPKVQKEAFNKALDFLEKSDNTNTMRYFYRSYKMGPETQLGKLALSKFDSIVSFEKTKLLKGIQGTWLLKEVGSNWGFEQANSDREVKKIIINHDSFLFFERDKLVRKEAIKFTETIYFTVPSFTTFDYSDGQIWNYELKDRKHNINENVLHLKNEGYYRDNGVRREISCGNKEIYYERLK